MKLARIVSHLSRHRLNGETVPDDVTVLLQNHDEFVERTRVGLNWKKKWSPWLDTRYLTADELANPDIAANVKAIAEVCEMIAFIGSEEDGNYFGYWRGPKNRTIANSPFVFLDNEGQFRLLAGSTFAEAILFAQTYDTEQFTELRDWYVSVGITVKWKKPEDVKDPKEKDQPDAVHSQLYYRHLGKKPPR